MTHERTSPYRRRADDGSGTGLTIREMVLEHHQDIGEIQGFVSEVKGAFKLVKWALGASLLSAVVSVIGIIVVVSHP